MSDWTMLATTIQAHPAKEIKLDVETKAGKKETINVTPKSVKVEDKKLVRLELDQQLILHLERRLHTDLPKHGLLWFKS